MLTFEDLKISDLAELKVIFKSCYEDDNMIHSVRRDGPAGYADGSLLRDYVLDSAIISQKVVLDKKIVGCYAIERNLKYNVLKLLCIDPQYKDMGLGREVWDYIEKFYTKAEKWYVEIPDFSERSKHFYIDKCGFHFLRDIIYASGRKNIILVKTVKKSND